MIKTVFEYDRDKAYTWYLYEVINSSRTGLKPDTLSKIYMELDDKWLNKFLICFLLDAHETLLGFQLKPSGWKRMFITVSNTINLL